MTKAAAIYFKAHTDITKLLAVIRQHGLEGGFPEIVGAAYHIEEAMEAPLQFLSDFDALHRQVE